MACRPADATGARHAVTHITVVERLPHATLALARLETGRTHQIRVHLQHAGYPVVGDPVYAGKAARRYLVLLDAPARATLESLPGQALHAWRLSFPHPRTGEALSFTAPTPPAFRNAYHALGGLANPEGHVGES
jgi:23S rRNA pseudouridine1911/1915/1917 synthase